MESSPISVINGVPPVLAGVSAPSITTEFRLKLTPFDRRAHWKLIATHEETIWRVVDKLKPVLRTKSALDIGRRRYLPKAHQDGAGPFDIMRYWNESSVRPIGLGLNRYWLRFSWRVLGNHLKVRRQWLKAAFINAASETMGQMSTGGILPRRGLAVARAWPSSQSAQSVRSDGMTAFVGSIPHLHRISFLAGAKSLHSTGVCVPATRNLERGS
jgi:hypothetical protein